MKNLILKTATVALVLLSAMTFAQSPTDDLFEKYGAKDGFTTVHVTKELFSLFGEIAEDAEDPEVKELQDVVDGLDHIRILMYDSKENPEGTPAILEDFRKQINDVKLMGFAELMTVKEKDETVKFMIRKEGKIIRELLLLINQTDEAGFISITGNINLKSISKLSKSMNIRGMENLEKIEEPKE